jgi:hypothetical protein
MFQVGKFKPPGFYLYPYEAFAQMFRQAAYLGQSNGFTGYLFTASRDTYKPLIHIAFSSSKD